MKYEIIKTDTVTSWDGRTLYRIKRVENGELGYMDGSSEERLIGSENAHDRSALKNAIAYAEAKS